MSGSYPVDVSPAPVPVVDYAYVTTAFPEFANTALYPVAQVNFWITQATASLNAFRFGAQLPLAICLYVGHQIVLSAREVKSGAGGQIVGNIQGPLLSKSIGPISASYSGDTALEGAGAYNFTTYGQRLYSLMKAYATGPKWVPPSRGYDLGRR